MDVTTLYRTPNALAPHYTLFGVTERLLLTGHSHQAWPDCAFDAQQDAWLDAAHYVDDKWQLAAECADRVRLGFAQLLGDTKTGGANIALAENTHELLVRLFSALDWSTRRKVVTTDGEFHSARRQLDRMVEAGVPVVKVAAEPVETVAERLAAQIDDDTTVVLISSVFFLSGRIVPGLRELAAACAARDVTLIVDAYHHMNVIPFDIHDEGLEQAFIVGAGYKYCQLGEGNGFMRVPHDCALRPVITGWFSEFAALTARRTPGVQYGEGGHRFAGATYDPTANYRAARVFEFFVDQQLTPAVLREVSQHQVGRLMAAFDGLGLDPEVIDRDRHVRLEDLGGFLALRSPLAGELNRLLKARDVFTDYRGDIIRFGPAPYLSDAQLDGAIAALGEAVGALSTAS
ncbi:MAG: aminotransferase class V-fold PLP-dependent enzyme [Longimicrobiales bacterium]